MIDHLLNCKTIYCCILFPRLVDNVFERAHRYELTENFISLLPVAENIGIEYSENCEEIENIIRSVSMEINNNKLKEIMQKDPENISDEDMERVNKAICFSMGIKKKRKSQIE